MCVCVFWLQIRWGQEVKVSDLGCYWALNRDLALSPLLSLSLSLSLRSISRQQQLGRQLFADILAHFKLHFSTWWHFYGRVLSASPPALSRHSAFEGSHRGTEIWFFLSEWCVAVQWLGCSVWWRIPSPVNTLCCRVENLVQRVRFGELTQGFSSCSLPFTIHSLSSYSDCSQHWLLIVVCLIPISDSFIQKWKRKVLFFQPKC